ncbi:MAG: acyl-CoA-binding protein [Pseudomonadales bacterium]|nr:acyl-CoA-binding protein [Pseudomonadales bacterium]
MGKLQEMVVEETAVANRLKHSSKRLQLAGLGLFAKIDAERVKLYQQIMDASSQKADDSLIGKLNSLGSGTVNFVRDESVRIFDELVEAGEQFSAETNQADSAPKESVKQASREAPKQEVPAKAAKPAVVEPIQVKTTEAPKKAARKTKTTTVDLELQKAFESALETAKKTSDIPQDKTLALMALALQVEEGDVKGRRPAKAKVEACEIFDARREIKGMKRDEAMNRYIEAVKELA